MARRERRRKQLLDELKEERGLWKFKGEAVGSALRRARFGRGNHPALNFDKSSEELRN
jgi:hypothetical protein